VAQPNITFAEPTYAPLCNTSWTIQAWASNGAFWSDAGSWAGNPLVAPDW
jgi:hypothetical protein